MLINYSDLFKPYTKDGHTLENTLRYLQKEAVLRGIRSEIVELAMNEVFTEVANGRKFSMDKCSCGCGIDKAATDLIHTIRDRMFAMDNELQVKLHTMLQDRYNATILGHIKSQNEAYVKSKMTPISERSPVLRAIKKVMNRGT